MGNTVSGRCAAVTAQPDYITYTLWTIDRIAREKQGVTDGARSNRTRQMVARDATETRSVDTLDCCNGIVG
jgi:hypothetical protein